MEPKFRVGQRVLMFETFTGEVTHYEYGEGLLLYYYVRCDYCEKEYKMVKQHMMFEGDLTPVQEVGVVHGPVRD